jgi:lipoate-protein ligase A
VKARFRPRNDIEVDGRKISGTGGFFDGDTLFFQGTVLVDMNPADMVAALRVPQAKLEKRDLDSAARRVVTLTELLGDGTPDMGAIQDALAGAFSERFGMQAEQAGLGADERRLAQQLYDEEIGTEEFVTGVDEPADARGVVRGSHASPGGAIKVYLRLEGPAQDRIYGALITGDFFVTPPRIIYDLESSLRGVQVDEIDGVVEAFFERAVVEVLSVAPADFVAAIRDALQ